MSGLLRGIVEYAFQEIPYYRDLNLCDKDDFESIPILSKEEAIENSSRLFAPCYIMKQIQGELIENFTSGSTGKCMETYWDLAECRHSLSTLWLYRSKWYGIRPNDKMVYFFTTRNAGQSLQERVVTENKYGFCKSNLNTEKLVQIYNEIVKIEPAWMIIQPSVAMLLVEVKNQYSLREIPSLRYMELTGEMLFDGCRKSIISAFPNCRIANQYGANEVNSIAYECPEGNLHCMESNVYVEVVDAHNRNQPSGKEGNILITSLQNHVMPLLRYKIGDRGILHSKEKQCRCGCGGQILELISGRDNDWIYTEDGNKITPYTFFRCIENINLHFDFIVKQFQIVQKDYKKFDINLVLDHPIEREFEEMFKNNLAQDELKDSMFQFHYHDRFFPDEQNGKLRCFINEIGNEFEGV